MHPLFFVDVPDQGGRLASMEIFKFFDKHFMGHFEIRNNQHFPPSFEDAVNLSKLFRPISVHKTTGILTVGKIVILIEDGILANGTRNVPTSPVGGVVYRGTEIYLVIRGGLYTFRFSS